MPIASSITAAIIAGAAAGGAGVAAAKMQANAAKRAGAITQQSTSQAYDYEREQDALERAQYQEERERTWRLEDQDRQIADAERARRADLDAQQYGLAQGRLGLDRRQQDWTFQQRADLLKRMGPYRQFGEAGMRKLSTLL